MDRNWEISPPKVWRILPMRVWEHSPAAGRRCVDGLIREFSSMFGKLAGAWLGSKVAGSRSGAKGAILGFGAAALARRSVPALAAVALGGWAFNKWREKRRRSPSYPPEAAPTPPAE
jgi:hypothetical protein